MVGKCSGCKPHGVVRSGFEEEEEEWREPHGREGKGREGIIQKNMTTACGGCYATSSASSPYKYKQVQAYKSSLATWWFGMICLRAVEGRVVGGVNDLPSQAATQRWCCYCGLK